MFRLAALTVALATCATAVEMELGAKPIHATAGWSISGPAPATAGLDLQFFVKQTNTEQLEVGVGGCWWVLVGVGGCWWVLVGVGGCWWALVGVGVWVGGDIGVDIGPAPPLSPPPLPPAAHGLWLCSVYPASLPMCVG